MKGFDEMNINDTNAINEIKALALDMISKAGSGSPGMVLSAAPIIYNLYANHLNINPENPDWINRDRFVLSSAHASSLLYATLHLCGYPITKEDLKTYRTFNSICPGHPEVELTKGIDITTGPSGNGIASAVGIALAERYLENILKSEDENQALINFNTYVLCNDTDLMEGIAYEALSFAAKEKLDKFILLVDHSKVTNDGPIENTFLEELTTRFDALDFHIENVKDGANFKAIDKAITNAKKSKKPSVIIFNTILGLGSRNENKSVVFNTPLDDDDVFALKRKLNITIAPFETRKDTIIHIEKLIKNRVLKKYTEFVEYFNQIKHSGNERFINLLRMVVEKNVILPFDSLNYRVNNTYNEDMRLTNHKIINILAEKSELFLGGGADTSSTTKAYIDKTSIMSYKNPLGRNINFGNRELAMSGILNGMASMGLKVYGNTYLSLSDYLKPSMRLSALMNLPITYIFTNDALYNNPEEGTLFEPIEQLVTLRSLPNMITFRPCDISEIFGCWEYIAKNKKTISLVLSNKATPKVPNSNAKLVGRGGYIIKKEEVRLDGIIIATGFEVNTALLLNEDLKKENLDIRIVSMPSQELYFENDKEYKKQLLPENIKKIVLEPSSKIGWSRLTEEKYILGIDEFGSSGKSSEILRKYEYDYESLKIKVTKLLKE